MPRQSNENTIELWVDFVAFLAKKLSVWAELEKRKRFRANDIPSDDEITEIEDVPFPSLQVIPGTMTIAPDTLKLFIEDIQQAESEFRKTIVQRKSCGEIRAEYLRAQESICKHLKIIKELNEEVFPAPELAKIWKSYNCSNALAQSTNDNPPGVVIQGNLQIGDNYSGDFRNAILSIKSTLDNVSQSIQMAETGSISAREELMQLIDQLKTELQKVPISQIEQAEAVAESAKTFVEASTKEKPNKSTVLITGEGLLAAAKNISNVMPSVLEIAKLIVKTDSSFVG